MTEGLDRAELISLLETLGSENDEEVLAAARVLDTKVAAAGTAWSVLLAPRVGSGDGEAAEDEPAAAPAAELPADVTAKNAESLALIDKLLSRSGHSEDLREELNGYKADIAEGELTDADHAYLRALYRRLSG